LWVIRSRIWLPRDLRELRDQPRHHVGDILVRHRFTANVSTPVGRAQFGTAGDHDGTKALIADQCQKRVVCDGAAFWAPSPVRAVAGCAIGPERGRSSLRI